MMLEINIDSEQNSFDQEHFLLYLELEDTVRKKEIKLAFLFSSCIVDCIPQLEQDFLLDPELYIVQ
jgi:hypothetical protein